jgi:hypothetical protein
MASAVAVNLRIYADRLAGGEPPTRGVIYALRFAAARIERDLKTLKKYRTERKKAAA